MVARPILYTTIFERVLARYITDQNRSVLNDLSPFKKGESSRSLNSNEIDIEGLKAAQRNELVGQNTTFS